MASNQEKLDHLVSQLYKQDFWSGKDPASVEARGKFIGQFLNHGVKVGDTDRVTSLAQFLQWNSYGIDNIYRTQLAGNAQIAALTEAVKALAAASVPGAAAFDQEASFARMKGIVDASVGEGVDRFNSITFTLTASPEESDTNG